MPMTRTEVTPAGTMYWIVVGVALLAEWTAVSPKAPVENVCPGLAVLITRAKPGTELSPPAARIHPAFRLPTSQSRSAPSNAVKALAAPVPAE